MSESKIELAWVTFAAPARLDSMSSTFPACARTEATKLYKGKCGDDTVVFIEDPSLRVPGVIPWSNISSYGIWVEPPPPVVAEVEEVELAEVKRGPGRPKKDAA